MARVVFQNAAVLDAARGTLAPDQAVVVEGQRIVAVGVIAPGAYADLLVVDGNPLENLGVLVEPEKHLKLIMKDGCVYRDRFG
jgi:imidazolonepropionase-like amidohydrolase